jgi:hypothetical protein
MAELEVIKTAAKAMTVSFFMTFSSKVWVILEPGGSFPRLRFWL